MKIIAKFDESCYPPLLSLSIFDAPHRRAHRRVIEQYREFLFVAFEAAGIATPIKSEIDLYVFFVNPTSTDNDNLLTALFRAMDGKALHGPGLIVDDGLIEDTRIRKFWPQRKAP